MSLHILDFLFENHIFFLQIIIFQVSYFLNFIAKMHYFRLPKYFFIKFLITTYNFVDAIKSIIKFLLYIEILEYSHSFFAHFIWPARKFVWRRVWTNKWCKMSSFGKENAWTKFYSQLTAQRKVDLLLEVCFFKRFTTCKHWFWYFYIEINIFSNHNLVTLS